MLGDAELEKIQQMIEAEIEKRFQELNSVKKLYDSLKQNLDDSIVNMKTIDDKIVAVEESIKGHSLGLQNVYNEFQKLKKMI
jgi:hypothetical protein